MQQKKMFLYKSFGSAIFLSVVLFACTNQADKPNAETEAPAKTSAVADTSHTTTYTAPENKAAGAYKPLVDDADKAERRKLIITQIDSTYAAIALLDDAKTEMTELAPAELTAAERNKKSKAIFNINIIQNELTRALDASILANVKTRTSQLAGITAELEKNVSHLQSVAQKLNKATQCIGRLTDIMTIAITKGWFKPPTPKGSTATVVKAGVN
jgi:hypothetical protein